MKLAYLRLAITELLDKDFPSKFYASKDIVSLKYFLEELKEVENEPSESNSIKKLLYIIANCDNFLSNRLFKKLEEMLEISKLSTLMKTAIKDDSVDASKEKLLRIYNNRKILEKFISVLEDKRDLENAEIMILNLLKTAKMEAVLKDLNGLLDTFEKYPTAIQVLLPYISRSKNSFGLIEVMSELTNNLQSLDFTPAEIINFTRLAEFQDSKNIEKDGLHLNILYYYLNLIVKINLEFGIEKKYFYDGDKNFYSEKITKNEIKEFLKKLNSKEIEKFKSFNAKQFIHFDKQIKALELLIKYYRSSSSEKNFLFLKKEFISKLLNKPDYQLPEKEFYDLFEFMKNNKTDSMTDAMFENRFLEGFDAVETMFSLWKPLINAKIPAENFYHYTKDNMLIGLKILEFSGLFSQENVKRISQDITNSAVIAMGLLIFKEISIQENVDISQLYSKVQDELTNNFSDGNLISKIYSEFNYIKKFLSPLVTLSSYRAKNRIDFSGEDYIALVRAVLNAIFASPGFEELHALINCCIIVKADLKTFVNIINAVNFKRNNVIRLLDEEKISSSVQLTEEKANDFFKKLCLLVTNSEQIKKSKQEIFNDQIFDKISHEVSTSPLKFNEIWLQINLPGFEHIKKRIKIDHPFFEKNDAQRLTEITNDIQNNYQDIEISNNKVLKVPITINRFSLETSNSIKIKEDIEIQYPELSNDETLVENHEIENKDEKTNEKPESIVRTDSIKISDHKEVFFPKIDNQNERDKLAEAELDTIIKKIKQLEPLSKYENFVPDNSENLKVSLSSL